VKLNNTYLLFNSGSAAEHAGWATAHREISKALESMRWPDRNRVKQFRIPRIVTIKAGETYVAADGAVKTAKEDKTLRNGVRSLRDQFRRWMIERNCTCEKPLSLAPFFKELRESKAGVFTKYPPPTAEELEREKNQALNESVGDFDFWFETSSKFSTVVEWETGNISSSHRSLNKMCLALMGRLVDAGVLIVPSFMLYPHLTDRIGNIRELQPYFHFWNRVGTLVSRGLLAVIEVEHDALFKSTDQRDFVPLGSDGNSKKDRSRRVKKSSEKR
jgi:hypothetical protein